MADIITDPAQMSVSNTKIDFEAFPIGPIGGSLQVGMVSFSASSELAIEDISRFPANGTTVGGKVLRSNGSRTIDQDGYSDIRIDFSTAIGEIGMGWFDPNFDGNRLEVFDVSNNLLEFATIPTGPVGGVFGTFRGIRRATNDISYAVARVANQSDVFGIDNVSFGRVTAVPEPSSFMLCAVASLLSLTAYRKRRRMNQKNGV